MTVVNINYKAFLIESICELKDFLKLDYVNTYSTVVARFTSLIIFLENVKINGLSCKTQTIYIEKLKKSRRMFLYGINFITNECLEYIYHDLYKYTNMMKKRLKFDVDTKNNLGDLEILPLDIRCKIIQYL